MSHEQPDGEERRMTVARDMLAKHWGHERFRPGQEGLVEAALAGRDVLGVLPTGSGKSVCYQLPALLQPGITVVVSPLVALMEDQVQGLLGRGISAVCLRSGLSRWVQEDRWNAVFAGRVKLLYVSPERLAGERFRTRIQEIQVSRVAVDEAHCISAWGHDFRPSYRAIPEAVALMGRPPVSAFTATATPPVRDDIRNSLQFVDPFEFVGGFDRPEITFSVFDDGEKPRHVADVLRAVPGAGVLYAATRAGVERWADRMSQSGIAVSRYHAGLQTDRRTREQQAWTEGRTRVMVATSAFGMGIDRSDVRFVVHVDLPPSMDAWYQEAGRAGRDRQRAFAVLLTGPDDADALRSRLAAWHPEAKDVRRVFDTLCSMAGIAVGSETPVPIEANVPLLASTLDMSAFAVRSALDVLVQQGALERSGYGQEMIWMRHGPAPDASVPAALVELRERLMRRVLTAGEWSSVAERGLAGELALEAGHLDDALRSLQDRGVIEWQRPASGNAYSLTGPRPPRAPVDDAAVRRSRKRSLSLADDMIRFAGARGCRRRWLLGYFGEASSDRCGACDWCLGRHEPVVLSDEHEALVEAVLDAVRGGLDPLKDAALRHLPAYRREELVDAVIQLGLLMRNGPFGELVLTEEGRIRLG